MATIRPMTPADYPAVSAMAHAAATHALVGRPTWSTAADVAAEVAAFPGAVFLVVEENGVVVGMTGYRLTDTGEAEIYGPLVSSEGSGFGAWLEHRVTTLAKQAGAEAYSMLIGLGNGSGSAWAQWRGYHLETEFPETLLCWAFPGEVAPPSPAAPGSVRPAQPEDLDRMLELHLDCFPAEKISREQAASLLPDCRVITDEGEVLGFCHLAKPIPFIRSLCIDKAYRRRGLGSHLMRSVLNEYWRTADQPLAVQAAVRLDNAGAAAFCRRIGFRQEIPVAKWTKLERDVEVEQVAYPESC